MSGSRRRFTSEYKIEAAHRVIDTGRSIAEVARELNLNEVTLGNWVREERRRLDALAGTDAEPLSAAAVVTPVVVDGQAAVLCCAASARASAGVRSPSEACGRSWL